MLSRRTMLGLIAAASPALIMPVRAAAAGDAAIAFIRSTADKLLAVVNGAGSVEERRKALAPIIDSAVDVNGVARFCLGRFWRVATPAQQQEYLSLFKSVLVTNIAVKLGDYRGVKLIIGRAQDRDDGELVSTTLDRPNNPSSALQWLIANPTTDPKVVDVIAEGTSLRVTQREDYASFLVHNNNQITSLLEAMRKQIDQPG